MVETLQVTTDLLREAKRERARRLKLLEYQQDPITWYKERFRSPETDLQWSLYPEYKNHKWDGVKDPFKLMFDRLAAWQSVAIESATSTGKSYMLPRVIYWFLDAFPESLVVTTAPKLSQLKNIVWAEMGACFRRFKRIRPNAEMFSLRVLPQGTQVKFGSKFSKSFMMEDLDDEDYGGDLHQAIGVVAGVRAEEESATKMQGFHRKYMLFVIEECAGVPQPVLTAIKNTCTGEYNIILAVGNPDSQVDALHTFAELQHVQHIRISAYDHPNIVLKKSIIPGAVTQKSIDIRRDEYGISSNLYKSRVRGIAPKQSADSLIQYDWIMECWTESKQYIMVPDDSQSFNALGVDVANSEAGDMAGLCWGKKNECWWIHEFQCPNANHLAHNLVYDSEQLAQKKIKNNYHTGNVKTFKISAHHIGVDAVGVGVGTVNEFVDTLNYDVQALQGGPVLEAIPLDDEGKPLYKFNSLRAQMYFQARLDLQNHRVRISIKDTKVMQQLTKELTMVTYKVTDGHIQIEGKEKIKEKLNGKSPNQADCFVYWNWVRRDRTGTIFEMPVSGGDAVPPTKDYSDLPNKPTDYELPIG